MFLQYTYVSLVFDLELNFQRYLEFIFHYSYCNRITFLKSVYTNS